MASTVARYLATAADCHSALGDWENWLEKPPPEPPKPLGDAKPNKYQGEARAKLRLKMLEARAEMNQTQTFAKAAEEAKKDDAAQLRATANEKAAEYEALLAKLKEKKDE